MKRSLLISIKEFIAKFSSKPWACFETSGPNDEGLIGFSISANQAFLSLLQQRGLAGQNDEETLQLFFLQMRMQPEDFEDGVVNPEATPNLSSEASKYVK